MQIRRLGRPSFHRRSAQTQQERRGWYLWVLDSGSCLPRSFCIKIVNQLWRALTSLYGKHHSYAYFIAPAIQMSSKSHEKTQTNNHWMVYLDSHAATIKSPEHQMCINPQQKIVPNKCTFSSCRKRNTPSSKTKMLFYLWCLIQRTTNLEYVENTGKCSQTNF